MNTSALIMLIVTQLTVSSFTTYFFWRVFTSKKIK